MNVLVAFASKHGSTAEIAEAIATGLTENGFEVELKPAEEVTSIDDMSAVVIGSAIYAGQWRKQATEFIERFEPALKARSVWLFSSGPIGEDPYPTDDPPITSDLLERTGALQHRSFPGKLDRGTLGFGERLLMSAMRAPEGDFRDWNAIRTWADEIAEQVREPSVSVAVE